VLSLTRTPNFHRNDLIPNLQISSKPLKTAKNTLYFAHRFRQFTNHFERDFKAIPIGSQDGTPYTLQLTTDQSLLLQGSPMGLISHTFSLCVSVCMSLSLSLSDSLTHTQMNTHAHKTSGPLFTPVFSNGIL
jgi:hypothetical protein